MIPSLRLLPTYLEKQAESLAIKHQREVGRYMTRTEVGEDLDVVEEVAVEEEAVVVVDEEAVEVVDILVGNSTMEWTSLTLLGFSQMKNGLVLTMILVVRYNRILSARLPFRTERIIKEKQQQPNWATGSYQMMTQRRS
jgi:hypothetical protein